MGAISIPVQPLRRAPQRVPKAIPAIYPRGRKPSGAFATSPGTYSPLVRIECQQPGDVEKL